MNNELSATQHIAQMMYDGQIVVEDSRDKFWRNTRIHSNSGFENLSSVTVRYMPEHTAQQPTAIGVDYGVALDNSIEEYPDRIADAVRRAHQHIYHMYFLDVRSVLAGKVQELVGGVRRPSRQRSFAIYAENLPDMRNKLYALRMSANRARNEALESSIMDIDMTGFSPYQEKSRAMLHFILPHYGNAIRISDEQPRPDIFNISPLLHWLGDPGSRTFSRADVQAVIDYNNL